MTEIETFENFDRYQDFSKILIEIFVHFVQNRQFSKFFTKSRFFEILTKIKILQKKFDQIDIFAILKQIR